MKNTYIVFIIFFLSVFAIEETTAQNSQMTGTVFMPVIRQERRTFRGRIYRNRLSSAKKVKSQAGSTPSSFTDVIISAHPISFQAELKPIETVRIFQRNATFIPRVVPVIPGTIIEFINRDRFFHNVFSITPGSRFNIGRKPTGVIVQRVVLKIGEIKLFCDIHAQMNATLLCLDTPYFTRVEANGKYLLDGLPEGKYEIRVYHPDMDEINEIVDLKDNQTIRQNFTLSR